MPVNLDMNLRDQKTSLDGFPGGVWYGAPYGAKKLIMKFRHKTYLSENITPC